ncbi:MAG: cysteine desulfurase-like protein [Alicyclobacillus sp.]|nr:cysteine desulfurase-like protein [Alicyclobacillus sp.]
MAEEQVPAIDVSWVRQQFPALQRTYGGLPVIYLDGPGGSQVTQAAIDAMTQYMRAGGGNLHGVFPTSVETEVLLAQTRAAVAALFGAHPDEVAFGANMTTLTFALARALAPTWQPGDEVVVTEMDHRANVDPWLRAARDRGVVVRWLRVNPDRLTLELDDLETVIHQRTRLVAVGAASNAVGTVQDVARIARRAHAVGAVVAVDAVHAAPHLVLQRDTLDADILVCSAYKFFGPHVGIAVVRRSLWKQLHVYKLEPAPETPPDCLETGTQNHEGIAGVYGALSFIARLGRGVTLHERLQSAMRAIEAYEHPLAEKLRAGLRALPGVKVYAAPDEVPKTPTVAFTVAGVPPRQVCEQLLELAGVFVADGDFYASTLAQRVGVAGRGGWVRAGLAPYNTEEDIDTLLSALVRILPA